MRTTGRRWAVVAVAVAISLVGTSGVAAAWATNYDRRHQGHLPPSTVIGGVEVGGMSIEQAADRVRAELEDPLRRPLRLVAGGTEVTTTAWDLGLRVDVVAAVAKAAEGTGGSLLTRVWRRAAAPSPVLVEARPTWQHEVLDAALEAVAGQVRVDPTEVELDSSSGWLRTVGARPGVELDVERSRRAVLDGLLPGDESLRLVTRRVEPSADDRGHQAILVRTGENRLYLYRNGTIVRDWPVATGKPGHETPAGHWRIVDKIVNPTWYNPGSAWARGMPARIGPGPNNPLGTHALQLDAPLILIHGTPDRASIGYNASHGCVRMLAEDELELFEMVSVGTPVVIVHAGQAQARTDNPVTATAEQAAAVQF
ncbi:MAG: L,D-transpeptidase family protein [Actinomycetota bacterium]